MPRQDQYEKIRVLRSTTQFTLYKAITISNQASVLMKVYTLTPREALIMFRQETCNLRKLCDEPSIINATTIFEENENTPLTHEGIIIFNYPGYSLHEALQRDELSEKEKILTFIQICEAVGTCFQHQIAHLDLRSENIFLHNGSVILGGFHNSFRWTSYKSTSSRKIGTSPYIAPEVLHGRSYRPYLADLWGLGILLHYILTHKLPTLDCSEYPDIIMSTDQQIPKFVQDIIGGLTNANPQLRPPITGIMYNDILNHFSITRSVQQQENENWSELSPLRSRLVRDITHRLFHFVPKRLSEN